jgi:type II secretory ATPase GspE/PulE/Tfp pilus assembly ATPase PilB-like protein
MTSLVQVGVGVRDLLGEILVRKGRIDRHVLARALVESRTRGIRLGAHLVETGSLYEEDVAVALAEQHGLRYVVIDPRDIDPALAGVLPETAARRLTAVPLSANAEQVRVAIPDPSDVVAADELRLVVPMEVVLVVAEPSTIRAAIDRLYSRSVAPATLTEEHEEAPASASLPSVIDADPQLDAPAVEEVNRLLRYAIELGASDLHFVPRRADLHVRARVDGVMRDVTVISPTLRASVVARFKIMAQLDIAERRLPQDGRVSISAGGVDMDLRIAVLPSARGEEVVVRIAYIGMHGLRTVEDLGIDEETISVLRHSLHTPGGAMIVAGPTGSGKTTTLYAAIGELNDGSRTIVSIEDPVESLIDGVVQVEVRPQSGLTFARGLRTILRADPDVILVGEIRDLETAEIALHAAMTGHVVLTTVHAQSAASGLVRLRELGLAEASLGSAVHSVLSQRLLRRPCPSCREGEELTPAELARVGLRNETTLYRPAGCVHCDYTGYAGRVAVYEALSVKDGVRDAIGRTAAEIEERAAENGMTRLYDQAIKLCESGRTTVDEVLRVLGERS